MIPVVLFLLVWTIYPMLESLFVSFHGYVISRPEELPFVGLENYWSILFGPNSPLFWGAVTTSLLYTSGVVTIEFFLGWGLAFLVRGARAESFFRVCWMLPMLASPIGIGMIWKIMFMPEFGVACYFLGLLNVPIKAPMTTIPYALFTVMIADIWQWTPFVFLTMLAGLKSLPKDPFEAAQVDGATSWQVLRYLTISFLKPVILIVLILRTTDALRVFDTVWMMTLGGPGHYTEVLSVYLFRVSWRLLDFGTSTAASWIITLIMIAVGQLFVRMIRYEEV